MGYKSLVSPLGTFQTSSKNVEDYVRNYGMQVALDKLHSYFEEGGSKAYVMAWMKQILQIGWLKEDDENLAVRYYESIFKFGVPAPMHVGHFICQLVFNTESRADLQRIREESGIRDPLVLISQKDGDIIYFNVSQRKYMRAYLRGGKVRHLWLPRDYRALEGIINEEGYKFFDGVKVNTRQGELILDDEKFKLNVVSIDELLQTLSNLQKVGDKAG